MIFEGANAKIIRAWEQTRDLDTQFRAFIDGENDEVVQELNPETSRKIATYKVITDFPLSWSVIIGELVHDLRSALDNAIYDLTIRETGHPLEKTEFPVFTDENLYFQRTKKGEPAPGSGIFKVRGINEKAKTVVKDLQQFEVMKYRGPDQYSVVALIHDLNIIDKHRRVHLCRRRTMKFGWKALRDIEPVEMPLPVNELEDGTKLLEWIPTVFDSEMDVEFTVDYEVGFADTHPVVNGRSVIKVCDALTKGAERVLHYLRETV